MDCSANLSSDENNELDTHSDEDHLLPSVSQTENSITGPIVSVCEIRPSFYLTATISSPYESSKETSLSNDQSAPHSTTVSIEHSNHYSTSLPVDFLSKNYSDVNKENEHHLTTLTTSLERQAPTEVKRSVLYKLILRSSK